MRILFVDDDAGIQALARLSLERIGGFTVEICSCGSEAVRAAQAFFPDVIILDVTMPGMDGPQTLRALRADTQTCRVPAIFLTANVEPDELTYYKDLGAIGVIPKPFDPMKLPAYVKDLLCQCKSRDDKSAKADFDALRKEYAERLPEIVGQLEHALGSLRKNWNEEALRDAHRIAHSLVGTGGAFGFSLLSSTARKLEILLKAALEKTVHLSSADWEQASSVLSELKNSFHSSPAEKDIVGTCVKQTASEKMLQYRGDNRLIYLVKSDPHTAKDISLQIGYFGYAVRALPHARDLRDAVHEALPAVIITDIAFPDGRYAGIEAVEEIRRMHGRTLPAIFIAEADDLEVRLKAVRAGGEAYFTQPLDISRLIDKLDSLTKPGDDQPYRVLIVDDEPLLALHHERILQRAGMTTAVVTRPLRMMGLLADFRPELILMDVYMPDCNGLELAKIIRQDEAFVSVPIVFLSSETDVDKQLSAMNLGGDDFLTKPIRPDHLISSVRARLDRSRTLHSFMIRDSLTGLLNHSRTKEHLDIELSRAVRQQSGLVFSIIDIDLFKSVNDTYGHFTGDQVIKGLARLLQQRLRKTDTVGRYGGEEFATVLAGMDAGKAHDVLDEIRRDFSKIRHRCRDEDFYVSFSCGIASYPPHGTCKDIIEAADKALYEAKRSGRNRAVIADVKPGNV